MMAMMRLFVRAAASGLWLAFGPAIDDIDQSSQMATDLHGIQLDSALAIEAGEGFAPRCG